MDDIGDKITKYIIDWAESYFRSRDAFHKKILSIEKINNGLIITFKDKKETILAILDLSQVKERDIKENTTLITLNNRKNVDYLHYNWPKLANISSFKIYFINPFSTLEKRWIINPHIHSKICDESTLRAGLLSMFETVEPLTKDIFVNKL